MSAESGDKSPYAHHGALARALRIALVIEIALYLVIGAWYVRAGGSATTALLVALGVYALWRLAIVANAFVLSRRLGDGAGSRGIALLRLVLHEWLVIALGYSVLMAFPRLVRPREQGTGPHVVLVHGYLCNEAIWTWFARALIARGYRIDAVTLEPVLGDIDAQAARLGQWLSRLAPEGPVTLVAHSMGGLVSRALIRRAGWGRIAKVITCGTPHQGTKLAFMGLGLDARQMDRASRWLGDLAAVEPASVTERLVCLYSEDDNLVAPQSSARLPGARAVALVGASHTAMPFSRTVLAAVLAELPPTGAPHA